MNTKNLEFLINQMKYTGFGDKLGEHLKEYVQQGVSEFTLPWGNKMEEGQLAATLHFSRSKENDMYFFNRYDLQLTKANNESMRQSFYIGKSGNITLKEGYNLMCGRAVHKTFEKKEKLGEGENATYRGTGEMYNAWVKLNFTNIDKNGNCELRKFNENYGFNLVKSLQEHPIKEMVNEEDKKMLLESLERGNRQRVTIERDGSTQKFFVEANPSGRKLNFYDSSMRPIEAPVQSQKEGESVKTSEKQSQQKGKKQKDDEGEGTGKKNTRRQKQGIS